MKSKLVTHEAGPRTFILVLDAGEEAFASITDFAEQEGLDGASLTALGAFEHAKLGWFDSIKKAYQTIPIDQQCEVLSVVGDIATGDDGKPSLHVHDVLRASLEADGCRVGLGVDVRRIEAIGSCVRVHLANEALDGSHLFLATGRQPNTDDLGLETLNVRGWMPMDMSRSTITLPPM